MALKGVETGGEVIVERNAQPPAIRPENPSSARS